MSVSDSFFPPLLQKNLRPERPFFGKRSIFLVTSRQSSVGKPKIHSKRSEMFNKDTLIGIGCDHAGFELKEYLKETLGKEGYRFEDFGTHVPDSVDYPDFAHAVAQRVQDGGLSFGILICGSGIGISIAANKHPHVRCALCWKSEIAALSRQHNNANILAMPGRFISREEALKTARVFFDTEFEGGRHQRRIDKIDL